MVKKQTKRGLLTADEGVYPGLKTEAQTNGWTINDINFYKNSSTSDETISNEFGKKRRILLTHDKESYKHNLQGGFKGYVVYEGTPTKKQIKQYIKNCGKILSKFTSSYSENSIIKIRPLKLTFEKIHIPREFIKK